MNRTSTILIVDDEPLGRETLAALLEAQGYQLTFATDGRDALEKAYSQLPDLILLDVMMPYLSGFEVCQQLRAHPVLREVPVIMLTALDDRESRLKGFEAGADDFLSKPFDRAELRGRIHTITKLNRYRRLLAERLKFEWVVEHADDGYVIVDEGGRLLYANAQARLFLSFGPDEAIEDKYFLQEVAKHYRCEPNTPWDEWYGDLETHRQTSHLLIRPTTSNADIFLVQVDLMEMGERSDERALIRLRDVTSTVVNQNSVWSFQSLVRHKLSTSLAQVSGALCLLEEMGFGPPQGRARELFDIAMQGSKRLQEDIRAIFQYLDAPDLLVRQRESCSVAEIPNVICELSASLQINNVDLMHPTLPNLQALHLSISRQGLTLIFEELMNNALKFHPTRQPHITVTLHQNNETLHINVCDDGITLAPAQLTKVWKPYYQAERFFTGQVAGMGLGLPMVAALVWRAGGTCRIYNCEPPPGVGIELMLPLVQNNGSSYV